MLNFINTYTVDKSVPMPSFTLLRDWITS